MAENHKTHACNVQLVITGFGELVLEIFMKNWGIDYAVS